MHTISDYSEWSSQCLDTQVIDRKNIVVLSYLCHGLTDCHTQVSLPQTAHARGFFLLACSFFPNPILIRAEEISLIAYLTTFAVSVPHGLWTNNRHQPNNEKMLLAPGFRDEKDELNERMQHVHVLCRHKTFVYQKVFANKCSITTSTTQGEVSNLPAVVGCVGRE